MLGRRFKLFRGDQMLGTVTCTIDDDPWYCGTFEATAAFGPLAPLFEKELALLELAEELEQWDAAYTEAIGPGLRLEPDDGGAEVPEPLLHFHGPEARWRF